MSVVLVTGASGEIGGAIARHFAVPGNSLVLGYNSGGDKARELSDSLIGSGINAMAVEADVSDSLRVESMFDMAEREMGEVDILINSAGLAHFGLLTELSDADWHRIINVNLTGVFLCCRRALKSMVKRKSGCIINISSVWGETGASCEAAYSAAKAGVIGLTRALAQEEGPSGIRVNCITPGLIESKMNSRLSADELREFTSAVALGRAGLPREVAHAAGFLAENSYVSGEVLRVDGGM